jgi:hypothetical protein
MTRIMGYYSFVAHTRACANHVHMCAFTYKSLDGFSPNWLGTYYESPQVA